MLIGVELIRVLATVHVFSNNIVQVRVLGSQRLVTQPYAILYKLGRLTDSDWKRIMWNSNGCTVKCDVFPWFITA